MLLLYLSLSWLIGIFLGAEFFSQWLYAGLVIIPFLFFFYFQRKKRGLLIIPLCFLVFLGGLTLSHFYFTGLEKDSITIYQGQVVEIRGRVEGDVEPIAKGQRLYLVAREIKIGEEWQKAKGEILVWASSFPSYNYGDFLEVKGELKAGKGKRISGVIFYPKIKLLSSEEGSPFLEAIYNLRHRLSKVLLQVFPEPQGSLAQGLLLGIRGYIPKSLWEDFAKTGTAHILAISGLHVSILAGIFLSFGAWAFGRHCPIYILLALFGIWLYALLSGLRPPVMRASIMGTIFLFALFLGRPKSSIIALSFAGALMVGIEPRLLWDISFQLSFLAMAGLILFSPFFQSWGKRTPIPTPIIDSLAYTSGAIIGTFPLIAYHFNIISFVGLPATFFALPSLPFIILTSAFVAGIGLFSLPLAKVLGWITWLFITYLIMLVEAFASLPKAFLIVKGISPVWIWAYYFGLGTVILFPRRLKGLFRWVKERGTYLFTKLPKRELTFALLLIAILIWTAYLTLPDPRLMVSFIDVGNGDAILIQKGMRQILIDGGPNPQALNLALGKRIPFWDRTIEVIISTHPDADHLLGLIDILKRYKVNKILEPKLPFSSPIYEGWRRIIKEKGIPMIPAEAGQKIILGEIELSVLHPQRELMRDTSNDIDNNCIVIRLQIEEVSFLFAGDLREEGERELLLRRARLSSTVLKVAHHGSRTSTSAEFLAVVNPKVAVISVGENPFGHPHPEVMERLKGRFVYLTKERGTIDFFTDGKRLWVRTEK